MFLVLFYGFLPFCIILVAISLLKFEIAAPSEFKLEKKLAHYNCFNAGCSNLLSILCKSIFRKLIKVKIVIKLLNFRLLSIVCF